MRLDLLWDAYASESLLEKKEVVSLLQKKEVVTRLFNSIIDNLIEGELKFWITGIGILFLHVFSVAIPPQHLWA